MFRRRDTSIPPATQPTPTTERVTSVLGVGVNWKGNLSGSGGVRIEGAFEGDINLRGLLVVGETGRVTCENLRANLVIIAGAVRGDITAEKVEIRATGRVWGNVVTAAFRHRRRRVLTRSDPHGRACRDRGNGRAGGATPACRK